MPPGLAQSRRVAEDRSGGRVTLQARPGKPSGISNLNPSCLDIGRTPPKGTIDAHPFVSVAWILRDTAQGVCVPRHTYLVTCGKSRGLLRPVLPLILATPSFRRPAPKPPYQTTICRQVQAKT